MSELPPLQDIELVASTALTLSAKDGDTVERRTLRRILALIHDQSLTYGNATAPEPPKETP